MSIRLSQISLWLIFVFGILLSLGAYQVIRSLEDDSIRLEQQRATDLIADALNKTDRTQHRCTQRDTWVIPGISIC